MEKFLQEAKEKDLDKIGVHCAVEDCHLLDFLPFNCAGCKKMFCLEHKEYSEHKCPTPVVKKGGVTVTCEKCNTILPVPVGIGSLSDPKNVLRNHVILGCKPKSTINKYKCTLCNAGSAIPVECKSCRNNYCIKHRFEKDHKCTKEFATVPTKTIGPFFVKSKPSAQKVQ
ncbi:hypothetical protein DLAC_09891 [Tieghemostelium lacteum]|uniref:AN1-type domain-containing protein n=1 Tax=Tieghemostelium lacteum TaxID=361077 RepID=A0A151Z5K4_TIELA|nr:hypothetical protein DLAC_09891 [Tieghemostelium lacteum]|eukprot:KYQ89236.1 hypothetical protein DLAC_09891 [Tieghemostelium lacteum]